MDGAPRKKLGLEALLGQEADEVDDTVGVAPLVVVPAEDLDAVADDLGEGRVNDGGKRVALEVRADQQVFVITEDALELALRGCLEGSVYGLDVGRLGADEGQVNDGDVGGGNAQREAVELAVGFRDDELEGLGGAGGAGNHVDGSGASAAQILVREVEDDLIVGVAVNGGHNAADDAAMREKNLDDGREAVGGAAGIGDDVVLGSVVFAFV